MTKITIVLEGPDGAGKTTLLNDPQFFPGITSAHLGPPGDLAPLRQYVGLLNEHEGSSVKFDRLHLGERIYGPIFRGVDRLGVVGQRMVERVMLGRAAVSVICLPPFDVAFSNWMERKLHGRELVTNEEIYHAIYDAYAKVARTKDDQDVHTLVYDYADPYHNVMDVVRGVFRYANTNKNLGPGIGRFAPGVTMLVGDQVNANATIGDYPFVADSGSSVWLTQRLAEWGVRERDLYWLNAADGPASLAASWVDFLTPRRVVALGKVAERWCKDAGLKYDVVPHPAFWKRFHSNKPYPLQELLP